MDVSGGGKTKIARLAACFWDADEGDVLAGGINVNTNHQLKRLKIRGRQVILFMVSVDSSQMELQRRSTTMSSEAKMTLRKPVFLSSFHQVL